MPIKIKKSYFLVLFLLVAISVTATNDYARNAPEMLVNVSAKLGCSLYYVSGFDKEQVKEDIAIYSPLFKTVSINFEETANQVTANLIGASASATYRSPIGCTLDSEKQTNANLNKLSIVRPVSDDRLPVAIDGDLQTRLGQKILSDKEEGLDTRALLVIQDGSIIGESYATGFDRETRFIGWSMAKSFTGTLVGYLDHKGLVKNSSGTIFREWEDEQHKEKITLQHLLTMTSGLHFEEVYEPGTDATRMLFVDDSAVSRPLNNPVVDTPGVDWQYSSGTANLLALYVHRALGDDTQRTAELLYEEMFPAFGMNSAVMEFDASGVFVGSSFMYATARDWARLALIWLNGGRRDDQRLLSPGWMEKALTPNTSENEQRYGYQLWLNRGGDEKRWQNAPENSFAARGNRGQLVMVIPELELIIVRLGWSPHDYPVDEFVTFVLDAIK